ncbi:MAG: uroporphyrinogen-III synthase [Thalassotalea sp.]
MPHKIKKILITRPQASGEKLAQQLNSAGFSTLCQPLNTYQKTSNEAEIRQHLSQYQPNVLIFVSVAAVEYAQQQLNLVLWQQLSAINTVIAVGPTTQQALKKYNIESSCPSTFDSEGMLSLPIFNRPTLSPYQVTIIRGESGREHLATSLKVKGATVSYLPVYEKIWLNLAEQQAQQWHQQEINCIVVTSNAFLKKLVQLIDITDNYWKNTCLWLVVSERIAENATTLGLNNVVNTNGATDQAIINTLLKME